MHSNNKNNFAGHILHVIGKDKKFFKMAYRIFEELYPGKNLILQTDNNIKEIFEDNINPQWKSFQGARKNDYRNVQLVIIHSLTASKIISIRNCPRNIPIAWIGWGSDYYDFIISDPSNYYCQKTYEIYSQRFKPRHFLKKIRNWLKAKIVTIACRRINSISTVIETDYRKLVQSKKLKNIPRYLAWNYGTLESDLLGTYIDDRVSGNQILLGNSASYTNNHIEIIDFLETLKIKQNVLIPLNYGDSHYAQIINRQARQKLGENASILNEFIPSEDYTALLKNCGFCIMNHKRQQAVGNIIIMMHFGARVFLRVENPVYTFFMEQGAVLNSIEELMNTPSLLQQPLSTEEIDININILKKHWSEAAIRDKTKALVNYHV